MQQLKIGTHRFNLPENWSELQFWQGTAIANAIHTDIANENLPIRIISIITGLSYDAIDNLSAIEYEALVDAVYTSSAEWIFNPPNFQDEFKEGTTPVDLPCFKAMGYKLIAEPINTDIARWFVAKSILENMPNDEADPVDIYTGLIACYIDTGKAFKDEQLKEIKAIIRNEPFGLTMRMAFFCLVDAAEYLKLKKDVQAFLAGQQVSN